MCPLASGRSTLLPSATRRSPSPWGSARSLGGNDAVRVLADRGAATLQDAVEDGIDAELRRTHRGQTVVRWGGIGDLTGAVIAGRGVRQGCVVDSRGVAGGRRIDA